jgi:molybdopterin-binding protein
MKLSARNLLKGKIVEVKKGQTTALSASISEARS